ncbi:MAG TPA: class I SAM-dependent methyltransferase [Burkholderiaceae bacterium]|nr:class I SAM-dependent methyltransferase [Burkholderiaceae bacterium]
MAIDVVTHAVSSPSMWVERWLSRLSPGASVLDLACGSGRHTRLAQARGFRVTAVDRDTQALASLPEPVERITADLENAPWPLTGRCFEAVVVTNYLYRPTFAQVLDTVAESGVLVYETFAVGQHAYGRPSRAEFLLQPMELIDRVRSMLHVLAYEDGYTAHPKPARVQRIAACRLPSDVDASKSLLEKLHL